MIASSNGESLWPLEVIRLQAALLAGRSGPARDALRGALWRLLFEALMRFLRVQSRHGRAPGHADLEDIASEKALEILSRAESGAWDLSGRSAAEVAGYLSSAARHGWIDLVHRASREVLTPEGGDIERSVEDSPGPSTAGHAAPTVGVEARELAHAVRDCAESLPARERRVWFFRAYYEMSSREIASHPLVGLRPPHVDVLVQRARMALRDCLRAKGHSSDDTPPGAFVELWDLLESMADEERGEPGARISGAARRTP